MAQPVTTTNDHGAQRRYDELRHMLTARGRVLSEEVHGQLRGGRADVTARSHDGQDDGEQADTECAGEIAERRLRALPFAVRCTGCEQSREVASQQAQARARRDPPLVHTRL